MNKSVILSMAFAAVMSFCSLAANAQSLSPSTKWHWNKGKIMIESPERPAGQKDVLGLALPKMKTVRVGFVGLGMRGPSAVEDFCLIPGVEIVALCDYVEARAAKQNETLRKHGLAPAAVYYGEKGYEDLCRRNDIDLVYIATDWEHHAVVAKCAMENGKNVADEVPSAMNLEECWQLIDLAEQKQLNCMILENCCYDWFEMRTLNMAQHGVFGEILHAQGAYIHNLDEFWDYYWKNPNGSDPEQLGWRLKYNRENRGDIYATHGLGPVAQLLDIHRGDRMATLVAMDTKSVHGKELVEAKTGKPCDDFRNGDHTTTLIRTANKKVIELQHDVMNPQPYNRLYQLIGSRGFANKYPVEGYALDSKQLAASGVQPQVDNLSTHSFMPEAEKQALEAKYDHPILKKFGKLAKEVGGHGGMDFIMTARLVYCLQNGLPLDMDVYDLAEWCSIAELGALSMDNDCAPVAFPDFTRGLWNKFKGYRHAYATPEEEAQTEAAANRFTKAYKEATAKLKLWTLYDNVQNAKTDAAKKKAQTQLDKAVVKAKNHAAKLCAL
uniref:Gfo/Idh/MocA family protein n=1 Tax=Leyella stercorea TaxID=363265 RepID=UPI003FD831F3